MRRRSIGHIATIGLALLIVMAISVARGDSEHGLGSPRCDKASRSRMPTPASDATDIGRVGQSPRQTNLNPGVILLGGEVELGDDSAKVVSIEHKDLRVCGRVVPGTVIRLNTGTRISVPGVASVRQEGRRISLEFR
jgi:hypothetical protein